MRTRTVSVGWADQPPWLELAELHAVLVEQKFHAEAARLLNTSLELLSAQLRQLEGFYAGCSWASESPEAADRYLLVYRAVQRARWQLRRSRVAEVLKRSPKPLLKEGR